MGTGRSGSSEPGRGASRRRRTPAVLVVVALGAAGVVGWAGSQGYVPPVWQGGWGCSDLGYPDPPPSYEELVATHGETPHCARLVRGEAWF